jgi:hypothetical protein
MYSPNVYIGDSLGDLSALLAADIGKVKVMLEFARIREDEG